MTITRTYLGSRVGLPVAVALGACALVPAAQAAPQPLPASGWHGREIREPWNDARRVVAPQRPSSVRETQRLLHRLGYQPGPVDGVLGPQTRSSVQWFQIKHGLAPKGRLDDATLAHLRLRTHGGGGPAAKPTATTTPTGTAVLRPALPALLRTPQPSAAPSADTGPPLGLLGLALAGLAALALAAVAVVRRSRGSHRTLPAPTAPSRPAGRGGPPARPVAVDAAGPGRLPAAAVGYARGRDRAELDRHSAAIRRGCSERGWALGRLVREGGAGPRRPGLVHALRHVADGAAPRLVVDEVEHLASTPAELAARLAWCARNHVDVVALDVGLDTGTREGRMAARCLLAVGGRDRPAAPARGRAPRERAAGARTASAGARASTAEP